MLQEIEIEKCW